MENNIYIQKAIDYLDKDFFKDLSLSFSYNDKEDVLRVNRDDKNVYISYHQLASLYYGLTIVKQKAKENKYEIELHPHYKHNGLMHDCSRNGALSISYIKEMIMVSALFGLNRFMLYTEDVYEIEGEPYFGYFRGKYTKEEIKEIDEYASHFGVELVPCIQTLSHLSQALRWRPYHPIKDSQNTLLVNNEKTYELIDKMIKTCSENFKTRNIHIGMDEAHDLGLKAFLNNNTLVDKKKLMLEHLDKVVDICKKYGLHPLMWEDMFFKIDPKATPDWYNFEGKLEDDIKKEIPEEVELIFWDYYHDDIKVYDKMFDISIGTGRKVTFAGASICWIGFVPNFDKSISFMSKALESSINHKISSTFMCSWGDGGNECSASALYPLLALQGLYNYHGKASIEDLSNLLEVVTDHPYKDWQALQLVNTFRDELLQFENPSFPFLYQDVLLGLFDTRVKYEFASKFLEYAKIYDEIAKKSEKFNYVFITIRDLAELLSHKSVIGKKIRKAYKAKDKDALKECLKELELTKSLMYKFLESYKYQWDIENKAFGFEITDGRIGFTIQRINRAIIRINDYLANKIDKIEELDEDTLPFNAFPDEEPHCFKFWEEIVSSNKV